MTAFRPELKYTCAFIITTGTIIAILPEENAVTGPVKIIIGILIAVTALRIFLLLFERANLYFPMGRIEATPGDIGLAYEDVTITTADGIALNGWFVPSPGSRRGILFFHGNAGNISHRLDTIRVFHELGLNTLIIDYRGYGRSKGRPSEKGLYLDAEAACDYLAGRTEIDPASMIAFGRSLGGAVAVELAGRRDLSAIIIDSAFTSTINMSRELLPFLPARLIVTQKYDTLAKVGSLSIPKLFIHSQDDEIVPFSHGERLFEAASEPKSMHAMRGRHNEAFLLPENNYRQTLEAFLN